MTLTPVSPRAVFFLSLSVGACGWGCIPAPTARTNKTTDGNVGIDPNNFPNLRIQGEPNDSFEQALDVVLDDSGHALLHGTIPTSEDIDVYSLGVVGVGDHIVIDASHSGALDSAIAIFDEQGRIAFENDDRNTELGELDPFLDEPFRRAGRMFLVVSAAPLAAPSQMTGGYDISVFISRHGSPPVPRPQILVLNFAGGTIDIPADPRSPYTVGPFDTADIWPEYAGLTTTVEQKIVNTAKAKFNGLRVQVFRTPGDVLPVGNCAYSTVFFGGRNPNAYGISQQVDPLNSDACDSSIIFTEMFTPGRFGRLLTADELGTAIGNVTVHEVGHLFGLNHVDNVLDLMDTTGGALTFLADQEFLNSPLDPTIFAIGSQDGLLLLLETLGSLNIGG